MSLQDADWLNLLHDLEATHQSKVLQILQLHGHVALGRRGMGCQWKQNEERRNIDRIRSYANMVRWHSYCVGLCS